MKAAGGLAVLIVLALCFYHQGDEYWRTKWTFLSTILALLVAFPVAREISWAVGLLTGTIVLSGTRILFWKDTELASMNSITANSFESVVGCSLFFVFVAVILAREYRPAWDEWIEKSLAASSFLGAIYVWFQYAMGARGMGLGGFFFQGSMMGSWIVLGMGFQMTLWKDRTLLGVLAFQVLTIFFILYENGASVPVGALTVFAVSWALSSFWKTIEKKELLDLCLTLAGCLLVLGYFLHPEGDFLEDSGRFTAYRFFMGWWWKEPDSSLFIGRGFGSFLQYGQMIQRQEGVYLGGEGFKWLHSDWLQILFETGFLGLVGALAVFWQAVYRAYRQGRHNLVAALLTFAAVMVFQFPWRLAPFSVAGVALGLMAIRRRSDRPVSDPIVPNDPLADET